MVSFRRARIDRNERRALSRANQASFSGALHALVHAGGLVIPLLHNHERFRTRGAQMQFAEATVHLVRNDLSGTQELADFFRSKGMSVAAFRTADEYIAAGRDDRPACLVLDLILPDIGGLEMQSRLADRGAPPVIFVTAHCDPVSVVRAMKNGAVDFLIEPVDYDRLIASVQLALLADLKIRNDLIERTCLLTRWQSLTPRETEVFHHTVAGLLNKQGAAELGIAENTYQVHRGRVMRKMNAQSLADLVRMATILEPILRKPCRDESAAPPRWSLRERTRIESNHVPELLFGGARRSGKGRGLSEYGVKELLKRKMVLVADGGTR